MTLTPSSSIRAKLSHPVIDADAHTLEFVPAMLPYVTEAGGEDACASFMMLCEFLRHPGGSLEERRAQGAGRFGFWLNSAKNSLDRATLQLPKLLYERMNELGIDFMVVYPSTALSFFAVPDPELRRIYCRAQNAYHADIFKEYRDRATPVALVPMETPAQAIEDLEHAVERLGAKVILIQGHVARNTPSSNLVRFDFYGIDSDYDYDPFWKRCIELRVAVVTHALGAPGRPHSPSSFVFGHIGLFASAHECLCKAIFLGGVTRRFPALKIAFLEGGVGWACSLYTDLVKHWQKRNGDALRFLNPANLDKEALVELFARYGGRIAEGRLDEVRAYVHPVGDRPPEPSTPLDEFERCHIQRAEDIRDLFAPNFFFGCEADDTMVSIAFQDKLLPFGARLRAMFSSDIGHWDEPDITVVLAEGYEMVEHGLIDESQFRDFAFANAAKFYAGTNPDFFEGTIVAADVRRMQQRA